MRTRGTLPVLVVLWCSAAAATGVSVAAAGAEWGVRSAARVPSAEAEKSVAAVASVWPVCPYNASVPLEQLLNQEQLLFATFAADSDFDSEVKYSYCSTSTVFYEGDIFLDGLQPWSPAVQPAPGADLRYVYDGVERWQDGVIPYVINMTRNVETTEYLMELLENETATAYRPRCVHFRPYQPGDTDHVFITDQYPCSFSAVGRRGGRQILNMGDNLSGKLGQILHLLMHVLGFWHENNRPGRSATMSVAYENISDGYACYFQEYTESQSDTQYLPYDIWSITHATTNMLAKTRGAQTLVPRNPYINDTVKGRL
ncbi:Zinc metalloproteinase nas-39 [Amphibalanus amphitrite]|uniref:Metalloendopeptidase n=1 Tax=Amphibalanus amphitrite TaxID=1232801 RepID=A0A6A4WU26_AMPAM|nr:Zinc metalloproteinase nas-39 [Amphibalanus amphitrite]